MILILTDKNTTGRANRSSPYVSTCYMLQNDLQVDHSKDFCVLID